MTEVLDVAEARKIAIGAFNISSLECIQAIINVAEELQQPVIISYGPGHAMIISLDVIGPIMVMMAKKATVPVCVHLDHCEDLAIIEAALEMGFTSVMYDGSVLPFEENVANSQKTVALAKKYNASVEAEIGSMGEAEFGSKDAEDGEARESSYTNVEETVKFVEATKIDALACSFGTVHGIYSAEPCLDFDRVKDIHNHINIPIVMHGGSGVPDEDVRKCIANGVRKINYYTYMAKAAGAAVKEYCDNIKGDVFYHDITLCGIKAMEDDARHVISVFSNIDIIP